MSNRLTLQTLGLPRNQITCLKNTTNNFKKISHSSWLDPNNFIPCTL